jgi:peptidoglycan hydrolase-like protein with peptidoglycan-binding domain
MLQLGDYNENVKTLQKRLNALGYDVGYPDGLFGDGTKRAVKNYQKAQGFEEDGIVWPGVWTALFPEDLSDLPAKTEKN